MPLYQLLFLSLIVFTTCYEFNLTGPQNKLFTWVNSMGVQQNLLLSQVSVQKRTLLIQRDTFPYDFQTDQNCVLTQSFDNATLYEPSTQKLVTIHYTHMQGNEIMSKNTIQLTTQASIKLTDQFTVKLSTLKPSTGLNQSTQSKSTQTEQTKLTQTESLPLYLYNNESLLQIDSKIYSPQPHCYMLSRMTEKLCLEQICATLTPFQLYDMEVGHLIKNFVLINGVIAVPSNSTNQLVDSVIFGEIVFTQSGDQVGTLIQVNEQIITLSGDTILIVKFQVSTINIQEQQDHLRKVGNTHSQSSKYDITITVSNPKQVFAIKTINLYKGKQLILSDRLIIKPSQALKYETQWNGDVINLPSVEILNEELELEGRYSLNFEITDQKTEHQLLKAENQQIIPETYLEEVEIVQTHEGMKLPFIIAIAAGSAVFLITVFVIWKCRKRIAKKCFSSPKIAKLQIKKQVQCDKKESGRQLNIEYEITFDKKPHNIASLPTSSTLHRQSISTVSIPQNIQNRTQILQCSFGKELPVFSKQASIIAAQNGSKKSRTLTQTKVKQKSLESRVKSHGCLSGEESLSLSSKWEDESYTKKKINRTKVFEKDKEQEQTEKI